MAYIDRNLMAGERVVYQTRLHWIIFWPSIRLVLAGIFLGVAGWFGYATMIRPPASLLRPYCDQATQQADKLSHDAAERLGRVNPVLGQMSLNFLGYALVGIVLLGSTCGFLARCFTYWVSEFGLTNMRVMMKFGLFGRRSVELLLHHVEGIAVEQSIFGRLFGCGTIEVKGTGGTKEMFAHIAFPMEFRRQVQEQIAVNRSCAAIVRS